MYYNCSYWNITCLIDSANSMHDPESPKVKILLYLESPKLWCLWVKIKIMTARND